ncbi:beta-glucosidase [Massilia sp. PAMC28688]|uniref:GH1 family beta-glucosidase n=1 Tax=Massilia sp. PAMC28688 TaxID=2861283 RepID=UPI001C63B654|nr:GH1 family beta-glucosidase [Massilia sp. PAMC28688]QYF92775.1 beta-glucosidase [Massilia sp. PAMC28688]
MTNYPSALRTPLSRADFGPGFQWGCSTSSFQIEGGAQAGGRVPSIWDTFCEQPGVIRDGSDGKVACDHYHRWPEDMDLGKAMGLNAYRFSISWPRIMSAPGAAPNEEGLQFYSDLIDGVLARGLVPWVTLYHWDLPQYLQDAGGWSSRDTVAAFVHYADVVTRRLGSRVKHWITHNEPWCTAIHGNFDGMHAPGLKSLPTALQVCHHVLLSHGLAVPVIRANVPGARVGIALSLHPVMPASDTPQDLEAVARHDAFRNRWFLDPLYGRGFPADTLALMGDAAPVMQPGDVEAIAVPTDFLGVNYYFPEVVRHDPAGGFLATRVIHPEGRERTDFGWEVAPQGMTDLLLRIARDYQPGEMYVTENGSSYDDVVQADGSIEDHARRHYLVRHLQAVRTAQEQGVPVKGYFAWSLLDNFEWSEGYLRRFGLAYVDFATQRRTLKLSGQWYRDFLHGAA